MKAGRAAGNLIVHSIHPEASVAPEEIAPALGDAFEQALGAHAFARSRAETVLAARKAAAARLRQHRAEVDRLAEALIVRRTLDGDAVRRLAPRAAARGDEHRATYGGAW